MGKQSGENKKPLGSKSGEPSVKRNRRNNESSSKVYDSDTLVFISMSQDLKHEGNKLFQRRDYEGAMLKYEKALKLLPRNLIDVSCLHTSMAACYMQMGLSEYPRAIHECNLALEVTPKYGKALLKRSCCYEALNRPDLALRDVNLVLKMEPENLMATEVAERVMTTIEQSGAKSNGIPMDTISIPEYIGPSVSSPLSGLKEKIHRKTSGEVEEEKIDDLVERNKQETEDEDKQETETDDTHKERHKKTDEKEVGDIVEEEKHETETETETDDDAQKRINGKTEEEKKVNDMVQRTELETETEDNSTTRNGNIETDATSCKRESGKIEKKKIDHTVEPKKHDTGTTEKNAKSRIGQTPEEEFEEHTAEDKIEEKKAQDAVVVDVKVPSKTEEEEHRTVKLVYGEDIRWAQIPINCSIFKLREIVRARFPNSRAVLIKYRDLEGDLVTLATTEELRSAEVSTDHGSVRFYIVEVNPEQDPLLENVIKEVDIRKLDARQSRIIENGNVERKMELQNKPVCMDDWIIQFAHLFKSYVGFESDAYLDLHEIGMELYSEAIEETVTSEEAQDILSNAADKFQDMAAMALFNWGNVHMSRARKKVFLTEDASRESLLAQVKSACDWAQNEYSKAGRRYEAALEIKPCFYEAVLALGQLQFERAKLSWYFAISTGVDLETWPSAEVFQLYNNAEENMEKGMLLWEETEKHRLTELSYPSKAEALLKEMKLDDLLKDLSANEAVEQAANIRSQINVLWGTILYERSIMEFKLGVPVWQECLDVAIEKFELSGASTTDIAFMIKNHCSNDTAPEGLGFTIDEIIQAWNEMYEAKRWYSGIPSFRLEPLLRRRVSKLYSALEHT